MSHKTAIFLKIGFIAIIISGVVYFLLSNEDHGNLISCSQDENLCIFIRDDSGGATASFFNTVYIQDTNNNSYKKLITIDKAKSSQINMEWTSGGEVNIQIPACDLIVTLNQISKVKVNVFENRDREIIACN